MEDLARARAVKAVVFNAESTLFNSFELVLAAYTHVAEIHNLTAPSPEAVRGQLGVRLPEAFESLFPGEDIAALLLTNDAYVAATAMKSQAFDGLEELLNELSAQGLKLAIVADSGPEVLESLRYHGIDHFFTSIVDASRVVRPKPSPEGFFLAVDECGVLPSEAILVGDSVQDVATARAASAHAALIITHGSGLTASLIEAEADYIIDSLPAAVDIITKLHDGTNRLD